MESFVEKFKDEVRDYFERLESGLLLLENDPENDQAISEIFRIMHSMKGSGGMFGFDLLSYVTHDLESLFELFRSKKQQIDSEVISFTLNVIDGLGNLMIQEPTETHRLLAEKIKSDTQKQIARFTLSNDTEPAGKSPDNAIEKKGEPDQTTYFISFVPDENIFDNGNNPLYLIDELNALGECNVQVSFDALPELSEIDALKCYISWYLFIATAESVETLNDVFIFVEDVSQIEIEKVSSGNVIQNEAVMAGFLNARQGKLHWNPLDFESHEVEKNGLDLPDRETDQEDAALNQPAENAKQQVFAPAKVDSIRVSSQKIDQYMNLVSELITTQSRLEEIDSKINHPELELLTETLGKLSRQLRDNAFDMSLIPLESVTVRFSRLIHDLSKDLGKEVNLVTEGMETEVDKNIIEKLMDPLLHILRNSMDHGIESKEIRLAMQKDAVGVVSIKASNVGSFVQIEIEDDGAGLDAVKIREKALAQKILFDQKMMTDEEIYQLIFEPGFTTSESVTGLSGRGVGMDVVRQRINEMRGSVDLTTEKGRFTRVTIKLPLSLSIIDGLLTKIGNGFFVIPSTVIYKIVILPSGLLKKEFRQTVEFEDAQLPFLNLHELFCSGNSWPEEQFVVFVSSDNQLFGLVVDEVIREFQAVIKPVARFLEAQDMFSGASILGTGQLALVIDTNKVIKKFS